MNSYYYTFGSDEKFPFYGGWVLIHADTRQIADEVFQKFYPSREPDNTLLNCSFVYTEEEFKKTTMYKKQNNYDNACHKEFFLNHRLEKDGTEVYELIITKGETEITPFMVEKAYDQNILYLAQNEDGELAAFIKCPLIGFQKWFYFEDDIDKTSLTPEEYKSKTTKDTIIDKLYDAINELAPSAEYDYYYSVFSNDIIY